MTGQSDETAAARYRAELASIDRTLVDLSARDRRLAGWRTAAFAGGLVAAWFAITTWHPVWWVAMGLAMIAFVLLVGAHESAAVAKTAAARRASVHRRLLARLQRRWDEVARLSGSADAAPAGPVSRDLDLTGPASVQALVSVAGTARGHRRIADWLTNPAVPLVATDRHIAATELAARRDERIEFYVDCAAAGQNGGLESLVNWCGREDWITPRRGWIVWGYVSAAVGLTGIVVAAAAYGGLAPRDWGAIAAVTVLSLGIVNLILAAVGLSPVTTALADALGSAARVDSTTRLIAAGGLLEHSASSLGRQIAATLDGDGPRSARTALERLRPIAAAAGLKQNALTFFVYLLLQSVGLWDVHVLRRLERWRAELGAAAGDWIEAIANLEALASVAALIDDYPDWASPTWLDESSPVKITADSLGHPLLPDDVRVANDVSLGPPGRLLLVTGSNMSGKSTMLRAIGTNVALAAAGGPVCAASMSLPAVRLATCIRVTDDLASGVSFYMAELRRLAEVVADAGATGLATTQLFLLDEILQGTNSAERQIAVARVLGHLTTAGGIGAVSTHDLELADHAVIGPIADVVHFRETIDPSKTGLAAMTFDHVMHPGVCPTTNALRLLEIVGLSQPAGTDGGIGTDGT